LLLWQTQGFAINNIHSRQLNNRNQFQYSPIDVRVSVLTDDACQKQFKAKSLHQIGGEVRIKGCADGWLWGIVVRAI
jgi:hypothetical protein